MMKAFNFFPLPMVIGMCLLASSLFSQSNINQTLSVNSSGAAADASALLDVSATDKGMLVPRMTTAQRTAIVSPATGLLVYDTDATGFWVFNGTIWVEVSKTYVAGSGISVAGSTISNTGDVNAADDITTATAAGGDLVGTYPNPTVGANAIGSTEITNASITAADLAAGVIPTTLPPSGAAGGDLTGTYPNPTVGANAIGSSEITDASIAAADLAAGVIPTTLPPSGAAGGDLTGTYPNPTVGANAVGSTEITNASIAVADLNFGTAAANQVLTATSASAAAWQAPAVQKILADADNDTKIQVEESADEDIIRFDIAGTEKMMIDNMGRVGIGASTADRPLTVQGTGANNEFLSFKNSAGVTKWHVNMFNGGLHFAETGVSDTSFFIGDGGRSGFGNYYGLVGLTVKGNAGDLSILRCEDDAKFPRFRVGYGGHSGFNSLYSDVTLTVRETVGDNSILRLEDEAGVHRFQVWEDGHSGFNNGYSNVALTVKSNVGHDAILRLDDNAGGLARLWVGADGHSGFNNSLSNVTLNVLGVTGDVNYFQVQNPSGSNYFEVESDGDSWTSDDVLAGGSKMFQIDHPLDPANKKIRHIAIEGPDAYTIYQGKATLDENGEAWVELPSYFETLNKDFLYQLTPIGGYAQVFVAQEVTGNQFKIGGGTPGQKVCWQVTATRNDPYARDHRAPAELDKEPDEQGTYFYPQGYGMGEEKAYGRREEKN